MANIAKLFGSRSSTLVKALNCNQTRFYAAGNTLVLLKFLMEYFLINHSYYVTIFVAPCFG